MTHTLFPKIRTVLFIIRQLLENIDVSQIVTLLKFPHGSCEDTCYIVSRILENRFELSVSIVSGRLGKHTHAWIEWKGKVIDITADQFGNRPHVYFGQKTNWYNAFTNQKIIAPVYRADYKARLDYLVDDLISKIDKHELEGN